jgi:hypothetical protein
LCPRAKCSNVQELPYQAHTWHILKHGSPRDQTVYRHLAEHFQHILNAPTFCMHVDKLTTTHEDVRPTPTLNKLFVHMHAFYKC